MELELRLKEILKEKGIEQKELAQRAGLTERTVSELCNNKVKRYPKEALEKIMEALDLRDLNELFDVK
ncbi:helix-turn-helix transcriptional regulator [Heyndrickxia sporothermodurans]|uniref:helix-turn-helix domain-containing protein n=1 Tax=Heyndrickxia sporothermodurans TaxID=46224 RepID=UPI002E1A55A3|nr:helix-turn-helix transcriptional regulator [Heyndrickxia sporothermodurans]MED3697923.1 helix-turn-helix transcriptional regulator [Heyndrickxia sporothermodurans]